MGVCVGGGGEVRFMGLQLSLINLVFLFSHVMPKINNKSLVNSDTFDFFKKIFWRFGFIMDLRAICCFPSLVF